MRSTSTRLQYGHYENALSIEALAQATGRTYGLEGAEIQDKPKPTIYFRVAFGVEAFPLSTFMHVEMQETIGRYGNSALAIIEAPNDAHANAEREDDIGSTSPEITPSD